MENKIKTIAEELYTNSDERVEQLLHDNNVRNIESVLEILQVEKEGE